MVFLLFLLTINVLSVAPEKFGGRLAKFIKLSFSLC